MAENTGDKIRRNTRANMIAWFWGQAINLTRMMVLFHFLNKDGYGLWIFAFAIMSYFSIYNFGIANAFVKFTAQYHVKKDYTHLSHLLSTGMAMGTLIAGIILTVLLLWSEDMLHFFNIQQANLADTTFVLIGVGITTAFMMMFNVYGAVLTGLQRLDIKNYILVAVLTFEFIATIILLNLGFGIRAVTFTYATGLLFTTLLHFIFVKKIRPELRINPLNARLYCLKEMGILGSKMQILGVVALMVSTFDIVLFMKLYGEAFVGLYGLARRFVQRAQGVAHQGFGALAPASADLLSRDKHKDIARIYAASMRFTALGSVWIFAYMVFHATPVMRFVIDEKFEAFAAYSMSVFSVGCFFHTLTGPGTSMLRGAGMPLREILYQGFTVLLFIIALISFGAFGMDGVMDRAQLNPKWVATWPIALAIGSLLFLLLSNRFFKISLLAPFNKVSLPLLCAPLCSWLVRYGWDTLQLPIGLTRWPALLEVGATGILYSMLYLPAVWFLPGLTKEDKKQIIRFIPGTQRFR